MADAERLLERLPDESEVRQRIAENQREASLLRSLLQLAKQKTDACPKQRPQQEVTRAAS